VKWLSEDCPGIEIHGCPYLQHEQTKIWLISWNIEVFMKCEI